jgi:hypothetical protein
MGPWMWPGATMSNVYWTPPPDPRVLQKGHPLTVGTAPPIPDTWATPDRPGPPGLQGVKNDQGKLPLSLIPKEALDGMAAVLQFGAAKYDPHNWLKGMHWTRVIDSALRHITSFNAGEDKDPESGLSHLDHALCCLAFLTTYEKRGLGADDRYKPEGR